MFHVLAMELQVVGRLRVKMNAFVLSLFRGSFYHSCLMFKHSPTQRGSSVYRWKHYRREGAEEQLLGYTLCQVVHKITSLVADYKVER